VALIAETGSLMNTVRERQAQGNKTRVIKAGHEEILNRNAERNSMVPISAGNRIKMKESYRYQHKHYARTQD
jgi:hypothetical protein